MTPTAGFLVLVSAVLVTALTHDDFPSELNPLGCYVSSPEPPKNDSIQLTGTVTSVRGCVVSCSQLWYAVALLFNGTVCRCSSNTPGPILGEEACNVTCGDKNPCGGPFGSSAYRTNISVPGPPTDIAISNLTETSVFVGWKEPRAHNTITGYKIKSEVVFTYSADVIKSLEWLFSNNTFHTTLTNLHPGTTYNLTICALSPDGPGAETHAEVETIIGDPDPSPPKATVIHRYIDQMEIKIPNATNYNGPVSNYRVVVINEEFQQGFLPEYLKPYYEASKEDIPYYITAELDPYEIQNNFIIGDKHTYNGFYNAPLPQSREIGISIGVVSSKKGITKVRYTHSNNVMILNVNEDEQTSGPVLALGVAVAIGIVLLIIGIGAVIVLRRRVGLHQRQRLTQSMVLSGPCVEIENTGFIPDEEERADHYITLKRQLWNIPRNFLEVDNTSMARMGSFGPFVRGRVQHQGMLKPSLVQTISDEEFSRSEKKTMLNELDMLIKSNGHENIIGLIGICELPNTLYVVLEDSRHNLKELLLSSRHRDFQTNKFSLISEIKLLQIATAISSGMEFLCSKKILHKRLCCRNIQMGDGMTPKISGFGLSHIYSNDEKPDYTRWTALEMFKQNNYVVKSDVWSFGCLFWEILALGGTLYNHVASKDVPARVMKGLRPTQLSYIGDELYQICLHCWQLDLDERPTFHLIRNSLEPLIHQNTSGLLSFVHFNGFDYEVHCPEMEIIT